MTEFSEAEESELTPRERQAMANENTSKGKTIAAIKARVMKAETGRMTGGSHRSQRDLGHVK